MLINVHCICLIFVVCSVSKRKTTLVIVIVIVELIYVCYLMYQSIILLWFVLYKFVIVIYLENCLAVYVSKLYCTNLLLLYI